MANTHIRDVADDLLADYRAEAAARGRSLQAELRDGLARGRPQRRPSRAELVELSRRLTAGKPLTSDSTAFIRQMRDAADRPDLGSEGQIADRA